MHVLEKAGMSSGLTRKWMVRRGPGFGVGRPYAEEGEPLLEVLRSAGLRASLVDRADVLQHHTCGANPAPSGLVNEGSGRSLSK